MFGGFSSIFHGSITETFLLVNEFKRIPRDLSGLPYIDYFSVVSMIPLAQRPHSEVSVTKLPIENPCP